MRENGNERMNNFYMPNEKKKKKKYEMEHDVLKINTFYFRHTRIAS